jgi:hypothetical protein
VAEELHRRLTAPHTRPDDDRWGNHPAGGPTQSTFAIPTPDNVLVVGAGGPGLALSWVLYPHLASSVSLAL